jgi:hypothetical protein
MIKLKKYCLLLLVALLVAPAVLASGVRDDDDKDPSIRPGIRRLHPERERAKAMKKLQEQMSRKADPNADPWDTSDEVWGTVDLPPAASRDSNAVVGRRLKQHTSKTSAEQAALDSLLGGDYSLTEYGYRRMTWRDLPVTATLDQLMPSFTVDETGDCYSRYVSRDKLSNEVYFTFTMNEDSVPGPLRLHVQYCADDPLDFDQLIFTIDGFNYPFYPSDHEHGTLDGGLYWECSDDVLKPVHKDLVYALAHSNWVALKLMSTRGIHHVKMLTDGQRADFAHTLDLYRLLGGKL